MPHFSNAWNLWASFRTFVWFLRCSWSGHFAGTWQPQLMILPLPCVSCTLWQRSWETHQPYWTQLNKCTTKTAQIKLLDCLMDDFMLSTMNCLWRGYSKKFVDSTIKSTVITTKFNFVWGKIYYHKLLLVKVLPIIYHFYLSIILLIFYQQIRTLNWSN